MSHLSREILDVTTAADGSFTGYFNAVNGKIHSIEYIKTDFANGVDFTITVKNSTQGLWTQSDVNASAKVFPRNLQSDLVGGAGTGRELIGLADEQVKVVIAQGGNAKTGRFVLTME